MSDTDNHTDPAFPTLTDFRDRPDWQTKEGMTLRQYAAIQLKVPNSGTEWLDSMICESLANEFAGKAMQGISSRKDCVNEIDLERLANQAHDIAGAMMQAFELA